jgi:hypothetical protein
LPNSSQVLKTILVILTRRKYPLSVIKANLITKILHIPTMPIDLITIYMKIILLSFEKFRDSKFRNSSFKAQELADKYRMRNKTPCSSKKKKEKIKISSTKKPIKK